MDTNEIMNSPLVVNVDYETFFRRGNYTVAVDPGMKWDATAVCVVKRLEDGVLEITHMGQIRTGKSWISPQLGYIDRFSVVVSKPIGKPTQVEFIKPVSYKDYWPMSLELLNSIT